MKTPKFPLTLVFGPLCRHLRAYYGAGAPQRGLIVDSGELPLARPAPAPEVQAPLPGAVDAAGRALDPRLQAMIQAGRYHGVELDPAVSVPAASTIRLGCARPGTSGLAASSRGSPLPRATRFSKRNRPPDLAHRISFDANPCVNRFNQRRVGKSSATPPSSSPGTR